MKSSKIFFTLLFIFFSSLLTAQNDEVDILQEKIAIAIGQNPDSTKVYLLQLIKYDKELSDSEMAYAYGRLGTSYGQLEQMDSARFYFQRGAHRAKNNPNILGKIYKQSAQAERNFSNYDRAFSILEKAEKVYRENNNLEGVAMVYVERASSYNYMSQEKKAIELLQKAIALFEEIGGSDKMIYAQQELAGTYANNGDYTFARDLYEDILPDVKSETISLNYYFTLVNYAGSLSSLAEYSKAKENYQKALQFFKENNNKTFYYYVLNKLGEIYKETKVYKKAITNFNLAFQGMYELKSVYLKSVTINYLELLNETGNYKTALTVIEQIEKLEQSNPLQFNDRTQVSYLENVKEAYVKNGNYKKALVAIEKAHHLKDSINTARNEIELIKIQEKYQNEYQRKQNKILEKNNQLLKQQNHDKKIIIILIILLGIIIVFIGILGYRKQRNEIKLKAIALKNIEQAKQYLNEKLNIEVTLNKERKETLEHSERELVANSMEMARLKNKIINILEDFKNGANTHQLKKKLQLLLKDENSWEYFFNKFVNVHPEFSSNLKQKYPHLTKNDVDFCALIKLRLTNKEIGNLLNINHKSVITKKYRLRKKLGLTEDITLEEIVHQN